MIKNTNADEARRNNLSGGMELLRLGFLPARRRGLGRNAGGIRSSISFAEFGADIPNYIIWQFGIIHNGILYLLNNA